MQILHWLFKVAHEQGKESTSSPTIKDNIKAGEPKRSDIVPYKLRRHRHRTERSKGYKFGSKNFIPVTFLCRKDVAKAFFNSTLNLRRVNSFDTRTKEHWQVTARKMKKEDLGLGLGIGCGSGSSNKVDSAAHVGKKLLPISDSTSSSTTGSSDQSGTLEKKDDKVKGEKSKTMSRTKELLRWAAAAAATKTDKGGKFMGRKVLHFRNRAMLKAVPDNDQLSNDSPKISFNWEVESCSTTSPACSSISISSSCMNDQHSIKGLALSFTPARDRKGNWITTDSEFVVLEL